VELELYWKDINGNSYLLGNLYKEENKYCFDINDDGLKLATHKGCFGIGEFDLLNNHYESEELFYFFRRRIPSKDNSNIEQILEELDMKKYDEFELLLKTKGILNTDRYYLEEA